MTYYTNIGHILDNGLHCCNGDNHDPSYVNIGHGTLIQKRGQEKVTLCKGGVLNDYIPFYFHSKMPMLRNIFEGKVREYAGLQEEIIYLVSEPEKIANLGLFYFFTNRHAYLQAKKCYEQLADLDKLDWNVIRDDTWYLQYSTLRKEIKQAEFLVYKHVPLDAISGIVVHNEKIATFVKDEITKRRINLQVAVKPEHYYI